MPRIRPEIGPGEAKGGRGRPNWPNSHDLSLWASIRVFSRHQLATARPNGPSLPSCTDRFRKVPAGGRKRGTLSERTRRVGCAASRSFRPACRSPTLPGSFTIVALVSRGSHPPAVAFLTHIPPDGGSRGMGLHRAHREPDSAAVRPRSPRRAEDAAWSRAGDSADAGRTRSAAWSERSPRGRRTADGHRSRAGPESLLPAPGPVGSPTTTRSQGLVAPAGPGRREVENGLRR